VRVTNRHRINDIRALCTGWVATYHAWKLGSSDKLFAKVDFPLEAEEVFTALVNYLNYPITDGLDFPLAISADATAFCILPTLYVVQEGHIPSKSKLLVERLSPVEARHQDFTLDGQR